MLSGRGPCHRRSRRRCRPPWTARSDPSAWRRRSAGPPRRAPASRSASLTPGGTERPSTSPRVTSHRQPVTRLPCTTSTLRPREQRPPPFSRLIPKVHRHILAARDDPRYVGSVTKVPVQVGVDSSGTERLASPHPGKPPRSSTGRSSSASCPSMWGCTRTCRRSRRRSP